MNIMLALLATIGAALVVTGTAILHPAAGYITAGAFLLATGLLVDGPDARGRRQP